MVCFLFALQDDAPSQSEIIDGMVKSIDDMAKSIDGIVKTLNETCVID